MRTVEHALRHSSRQVLGSVEPADVLGIDEHAAQVLRPSASNCPFELTQAKRRASYAVTPLASLHRSTQKR